MLYLTKKSFQTLEAAVLSYVFNFLRKLYYNALTVFFIAIGEFKTEKDTDSTGNKALHQADTKTGRSIEISHTT